jgi:alpha-tubulin suppressor-like RCC1 family protein
MAIFNNSWPYGFDTPFNAVQGVFQKIVAGGAHTVALSSGKIFGCGATMYGQLNQEDEFNVTGRFRPFFTNSSSASASTFLEVKCGYFQTFVRRDDGIWFTCGRRTAENFLGVDKNTPGNFGPINPSGQPEGINTLTKLADGFDNWLPENLYVGDFHLAGLSGNTIYTVGNNGYGQLGKQYFPPTTVNYGYWTPIFGRWDKLAEAANPRTTIALSGDTWYGCGLVTNGELGRRISQNSTSMLVITGGKWERVIAAFERTYVLSASRWHATGRNEYGQLGVGDTATRYQFTPLTGNWLDIVPGDYHTFALSSNGVWFGCGRNLEKQLGLADSFYSSFQVVMNGVTYIDKIVTGVGTTFALIKQDTYQPPLSGNILTFQETNITTFSGINIRLI